MWGIYLTNLPLENSEVSRKLASIKFRGPDHIGLENKDSLIFGHLRLSIIDLESRSNQPMSYKNLTIVFNGEIYNFNSIKKPQLKSCGFFIYVQEIITRTLRVE